MKILKLKKTFILSLASILVTSCIPTEPIVLHGDISGIVTDKSTRETIQDATVILYPSSDTTLTGRDGSYIFKNLIPGEYDIQASKVGYDTSIVRNVTVYEAKTDTINLTINKTPLPRISPVFIEFGLDSTSQSFTISNSGVGKLNYYITKNRDWISVYPSVGDVTKETDIITVTIDRTNLPGNVYYETINITTFISPDKVKNITIDVYLNGFMTPDTVFVKAIQIGTQIWMAENLNVGELVPGNQNQTNNGNIEKYCYNNLENFCASYGGLYQWDEMMQYHPSDSGITGITRGICPEGWHLPTKTEFQILIDYLGGIDVAGGKLKETGTEHWDSPNLGATNESGFTAIGGGDREFEGSDDFIYINQYGFWWSSTEDINPDPYYEIWTFYLTYDDPGVFFTSGTGWKAFGCSVRCIKD
jgi:uncharacterized protein (TIGR02145 family)